MPRKKRINRLYSLDTETIGLDGDIKRIALYDGQEVHYGYTFDDVEPILIEGYKRGENPHVYIHNLEFDARKMPKIFERGNINWNQTILISNKYARIRCQKYTLHDSFKLLPMSLANLSKAFDLEHGKLDLWEEVQREYPGEYTDHVDFLNRCDPDNKLYLKYLGFDVISLYELIEKLMDVSGLSLDEMIGRLSTASLSRFLFKNGYKGRKFITEGERLSDYDILTKFKAWGSDKPQANFHGKSYLDIENIIREGYSGGRTEVFIPRLEGGKGWHFDINSLYPSVMIDNEYPISTPEYYDNPALCKNVWNMWKSDGVGLGFIRANVYIPLQHIPPLPVKMGKLVFPCGEVSGVWTFTELDYAMKNCGVELRDISEVVYFKRTFKVFKNFVSCFYDLKTEGKTTGNPALTQLAKLILNTGYGWTALRRDDKTELKDIDQLEKYEDRLNYTNEELGFINIQSIVKSDSIQPQIGAYVTSYARLALLDMLRRMDAKTNVYYCDTDSIVTGEPLPAEYVHATDLGKWDLEGVLTDGIFLFPKVYTEVKEGKNTVKFKGISRETQTSLDFQFYSDLLEKLKAGSKDEIIVERGKELLRSIMYTQKMGIDANRLEYRDKKINLANVQKRNMDYSNNSSMPWYFETLEEFNSFTFAEPVLKWSEHGNLFNPFSSQPKRGGKV